MKRSSNENNKIHAVIICGPTGSGKSSLAMRLAERFGGRIVGADSRQIYRLLDIGTAKPSKTDRAKIPHYMIDIADVTEDFTAKRYAEMAGTFIKETAMNGAIPFIVGGAGLYLEALTGGLFEGPDRDSTIRTKLELIVVEDGPEKLHQELTAVDPQSAGRISPNDSIRLIRALEVYRSTGRPISEMQSYGRYQALRASYLWLGLSYERPELYRRIDWRVDKMIEDGLVDEVRELSRIGLKDPIINKGIVGYAEIIKALENKISIDEAIAFVKQHSRNYAKRQLTWFRNKAPVTWISPESASSYENIIEIIERHLTKELDS